VLKKVVIIGPESTGKSTLCAELARHYNTRWCPEYAREYLLQNGMNYTYDDLLTIARGQVAQEDRCTAELEQALSAGTATTPLLFVDTDMYVMKVWCQFVFGKCHQWILDQLEKRKYDLYLLCNIDLPWVKDELREYPDLERRQQLYTIYKEMMMHQPVPWIDISGTYEERWQKALAAIDRL